MSRYRIDAKEEKFAVSIGWDNPLQTFFIQVEDSTIKEEETMYVLWEGTAPAQITTVEDLQEIVKPYAEIPIDILHDLRQDYKNRTEPTPLQKMSAKLWNQFMENS